MTKKTFRIATIDLGEGIKPMRQNDGAMIIMEGEAGDEETRPALHVPMIVRPKRGEGWRTDDPEQEAFARRVVDLLNAEFA